MESNGGHIVRIFGLLVASLSIAYGLAGLLTLYLAFLAQVSL